MKKISSIIVSLLLVGMAVFAASGDLGVTAAEPVAVIPATGVSMVPGWVIPVAIVAVVAMLAVILLPQILKKKK